MYWARTTPHAVLIFKWTIPFQSLKDDTLHQQVKCLHMYIFNIHIHNNSALAQFENTGCFCFHVFHFISETLVKMNLIFLNVDLQEKNLFMLLLPAYHSLSSSELKTKDLYTLTVRYCLSDGLLSMDQETELCSFTSCLFLYSSFILIMHFDEEESLLQATLNLSVHDCYDITC